METTSLFTLLAQAGWTMVPLYVCSLAAFLVLVRKFIQFTHEKVGDTSILANPLLDGPDRDALVKACEANDSPLARVLAVAAARADDRKRAEEAAMRKAVSELDHFEAWIPLLGFLAQAAPLFGLLGTVVGMVDLFASMESAGNEVSTTTLSSGIWKALLTTAAGLVIAIPALGAHLWFSRQLQLLQHRMEEGVGRILERAP
jgi:biopolymer transport protein ExbB